MVDLLAKRWEIDTDSCRPEDDVTAQYSLTQSLAIKFLPIMAMLL